MGIPSLKTCVNSTGGRGTVVESSSEFGLKFAFESELGVGVDIGLGVGIGLWLRNMDVCRMLDEDGGEVDVGRYIEEVMGRYVEEVGSMESEVHKLIKCTEPR